MAIWQWKMMLWGVLGSSEKVRSVAELWMIGGEIERSFVRRQRTEPFFLVFGYGCLLHPSLYSRDDLVRDFAPNSDCQK